MAWSTPATAVTLTTIASADWNTHADDLTFLHQPPSCRVMRTATQAIGTSSDTAILFTGERWDTDNMHSILTNTSRITINTAGVYMVGGCIEFDNDAGGSFRQLSVRVNGSTHIVMTLDNSPDASIVSRQSVTTAYSFAATDYVELIARQDSGGNLNVNNVGNYSPEFWAMWVSA
jgi:hypothetical protein